MLTNKHLFEEIAEMEKVIEELKKDKKTIGDANELKASTLMLKLLQNIRTNMVLVMKHLGIPLAKEEEKSV